MPSTALTTSKHEIISPDKMQVKIIKQQFFSICKKFQAKIARNNQINKWDTESRTQIPNRMYRCQVHLSQDKFPPEFYKGKAGNDRKRSC